MYLEFFYFQAKHKNAPGKVFQPETPSGFTDLESEEDDERNDPSWKVSSAVARNLPKVGPGFKLFFMYTNYYTHVHVRYRQKLITSLSLNIIF